MHLGTTAASLRLFVFRPLGSAATVDESLRETVVPEMWRQPALLDAYAARHGDEAGDRVIASVWQFPPVAVEEQLFLRTGLAGVDAALVARSDVLTLQIEARFERDRPARILRVFRGTVQSGELDAYIAEAERGMEADAAVNAGLIAFYLGRSGEDTFVAVSAWTDWDAIAMATGGDIRRPFATKHTQRLVGFAVDHFEVLPDTSRPASAGAGSVGPTTAQAVAT